MATNRPIRVDILARRDTSASNLFGFYDVLSSVGVAWEAHVTGAPEKPQFDVRIVSATKERFQCASGVFIDPHADLNEAEHSDVVIVASLVTPSWALPKDRDERELDWLSRQQARGAIMAAGCTGVILLADAGLLNDREATTHWAFRDLFRIHYPKVQLRTEKNLCVAGHDNRIVTAGGTTAWHELVLSLIVRFCGIEHASHAAKFWLIPDQGQSQMPYSVFSKGIPHDDAVVTACQGWMAENYTETNPVSKIAEKSELPRATFTRRFKRATGYHPMDYVHSLRVEEAKKMLETSDQAIDEVGREVGYEDPASFRRLFKRKTRLTPFEYRRSFGKTRFGRYDMAE